MSNVRFIGLDVHAETIAVMGQKQAVSRRSHGSRSSVFLARGPLFQPQRLASGKKANRLVQTPRSCFLVLR